jgi:hypothetical protein
MTRRDLMGAWHRPEQAMSAGRPLQSSEGTKVMIVLGADMHKSSHTIAAVGRACGELLGDKTIAVGDGGFAAALAWARGLEDERVWALEDCRHVPGARRQPPDQHRHPSRVAVTRARCPPETKAYIERKRAEGKTNRDAIRCLKRHLARRIWHLLQPATPDNRSLSPSIS